MSPSPTSSHQPTVVLVDHEPSINGLINQAMRQTSISDVASLADMYSIKAAIVDLNDDIDASELIERALARIKEVCPTPHIVLVDICFDRSHSDARSWQTGRGLALGLRDKLRPIPVGVYTKVNLNPIERVLLSTDRFSALLEDFDELCSGRTPFGANEWNTVFRRLIDQAKAEASRRPLIFASPRGDGKAVWADGHPRNTSPSYKQAALRLADLAFDWLDPAPDKIILSELGGGFSGSFVVKAEIPRPTGHPLQYVIKIDEDPSKLEAELRGYGQVQSTVEGRYYLKLPGISKQWPVTLCEDLWGAFVLEYEEEAKPLIAQQSSIDNADFTSLFERLWSECLRSLYGQTYEKTISVDEIVPRSIARSSTEALRELERYFNRATTLMKSARGAFDHGVSVISNLSNVHLSDQAELRFPWVDRVHGDLNCRNVLYSLEHKQFRLIDFPHVGKPSCLATDFAKAEAELVIVLMDYASGRDADFERLSAWSNLTLLLSAKFNLQGADLSDQETNRILTVARSIRGSYASLHSDCGQPMESYRLLILSTLLRYIGYADVSASKRILALTWVGQLSKIRW